MRSKVIAIITAVLEFFLFLGRKKEEDSDN